MSELSRSDERPKGERKTADEAVPSPVRLRAPDDTARGSSSWQCFVLVEITNFVMLRRQLGSSRAQALVGVLALHVRRSLPEATIATSGRDTVEVRFHASAPDQLDDVLATIATMIGSPVDVEGESCVVEVALGGVRSESQVDDVRLSEEAEAALREAREEQVVVARDVRHDARAIDKIALTRDLLLAIERDELLLEYQPKVHLRRQEVRSIEALIRWRHPTRGMVYPGDFIALAEESRVIGALTLWTLRQAIADQQTLANSGHDLTVFVNISGMLLSDASFVEAACRLVEGSASRLGFEITETAVIRDPEGAIANLKLFAKIGVTLAIDDYGAGLSSLAYLKKLPARELKIDKLFVTKLTSSNRDPLIVRSTIDLAHALDMEVVAEGVETLPALALLSVMGCDMAQGFLISRPIGLDALIPFLDEQPHRDLVQNMASPFKRLLKGGKNG